MKPMPLPPPQSSAYNLPVPSAHGTHTPANSNHMLDYLESQVRGMDMATPLLQVCDRLCSSSSSAFLLLLFCNPIIQKVHSELSNTNAKQVLVETDKKISSK